MQFVRRAIHIRVVWLLRASIQDLMRFLPASWSCLSVAYISQHDSRDQYLLNHQDVASTHPIWHCNSKMSCYPQPTRQPIWQINGIAITWIMCAKGLHGCNLDWRPSCWTTKEQIRISMGLPSNCLTVSLLAGCYGRLIRHGKSMVGSCVGISSMVHTME